MSEYSVKINSELGVVEVSGDKEFVNEKLRELAPVYERVATARKSATGGDGPTRARKPRPRTSAKTTENGTGKATRRRSGGPTRIKGLDLAPKGQTSFETFVTEKQAETQDDKNTLCVYYLAEIAEIASVTPDHVYTCYRYVDWAVPADLRNSLQRTSSRKGYLDTSNMDDIGVEPKGVNHVERRLPGKKGT